MSTIQKYVSTNAFVTDQVPVFSLNIVKLYSERVELFQCDAAHNNNIPRALPEEEEQVHRHASSLNQRGKYDFGE